jgi:hypothetical protein
MTPTQASNLSKRLAKPRLGNYRAAPASLWPRHPNLRLRPPKPALGRGRLQRQIRRAFLFGEELSSSQIYDWCYAGCARPLSTRQRYSVWRLLVTMADRVGRVWPGGNVWRLRADTLSALHDSHH